MNVNQVSNISIMMCLVSISWQGAFLHYVWEPPVELCIPLCFSKAQLIYCRKMFTALYCCPLKRAWCTKISWLTAYCRDVLLKAASKSYIIK